ncbi:MAG: hypothetical protein M5U26_15145 [Planctomycetota bacterium]|nr:hypothetical protein [Planctomycetota bacterium]
MEGAGAGLSMALKAWITLAFGFWVIAGGVWRYVQAESANALGFGLFMGVQALAGAALFFVNKPLAGRIVAGVAVLFVGGFFAVKGPKEGFDARVAITLAASLIEALVLVLPLKRAPEPEAA